MYSILTLIIYYLLLSCLSKWINFDLLYHKKIVFQYPTSWINHILDSKSTLEKNQNKKNYFWCIYVYFIIFIVLKKIEKTKNLKICFWGIFAINASISYFLIIIFFIELTLTLFFQEKKKYKTEKNKRSG